MWLLSFRAEQAAKRLRAAVRQWYPFRRASGWRAMQAAIEAHLRDAALWAELADALGEDEETTLVRPASRVRPYLDRMPAGTWTG